MARQSGPESSSDVRVILKLVTEPDAVTTFEQFIQTHLHAHDRIGFDLLYRHDVPIIDCGFASDWHYYVLSNNKFCLFKVRLAEGKMDLRYKFECNKLFRTVSCHPKNQNLFALCTKTHLVIVDISCEKPIAQFKIGHSMFAGGWTSDGSRIICVSEGSEIYLVDLKGSLVSRAGFDQRDDFHENCLLLVHPSNPFAVVCRGKILRFLDLSESAQWKEGALRGEVTCGDFMQDEFYGAAFGFADGVIALYSFESCQLVVEQKLGTDRISVLSFCRSRSGVIAFACGSELFFATLPQWGFGHFGITKKCRLDASPIVKISWSLCEPMCLMSSDEDQLVHIFEVPGDYMPLYEPDEE
jgi:WD40 repeat protein